MTADRWPSGDHYRVLGVSPAATAEDIRRAYRRLARDLHPDLNRDLSAAERLKLVTAAYNVLKHPGRRARYDAAAKVAEATAQPQGARQQGARRRARRFEPIRCSSCHVVTAQPRFVVFYEVRSALLRSARRPIQGIYCASCAGRKGLRASFVTWMLGWWSLLGPIYSIHALVRNLLGGSVSPEVNADLLTHQAIAFFERGHHQLAGGVARHARRYALRAGRDDLVKLLDPLLQATAPQRRLRNPWRRPTFAMMVQGMIMGAALALFGAILL